jgi:hypothetical protein
VPGRFGFVGCWYQRARSRVRSVRARPLAVLLHRDLWPRRHASGGFELTPCAAQICGHADALRVGCLACTLPFVSKIEQGS